MEDSSKPKTEDINCPFLKIAAPQLKDEYGTWKTISEVSDQGLSYPATLAVYMDVLTKQQGFSKVVDLNAKIDLHALNQVPGVSHPDKYNRHMKLTQDKLGELANAQGQVSLQDLVNVKIAIAKEENISVDDILRSSRIETGLLFLGAGGDLETKLVKLEDVFTFLSGKKPEAFKPLTLGEIHKVEKQMKWEVQ